MVTVTSWQVGTVEVKDLPEINFAARRLVALECYHFAANATPDREERWGPYRKWADKLDHTHTIINFNYDLVVERLLKPGSRLWSPLPGERSDSVPGRWPTMLKLHGSVDWRRVYTSEGTQSGFERTEDPAFLAACEGRELAIATPGPCKQNTAKEYESLWYPAMYALTKATSAVFVGYRFPPTDAMAREELLGALARNAEPSLGLHVVLGPNTRHEDVERLEALLRYTVRRRREAERGLSASDAYTLKVHPLFAQDFLSLWNPELTAPLTWAKP